MEVQSYAARTDVETGASTERGDIGRLRACSTQNQALGLCLYHSNIYRTAFSLSQHVDAHNRSLQRLPPFILSGV